MYSNLDEAFFEPFSNDSDKYRNTDTKQVVEHINDKNKWMNDNDFFYNKVYKGDDNSQEHYDNISHMNETMQNDSYKYDDAHVDAQGDTKGTTIESLRKQNTLKNIEMPIQASITNIPHYNKCDNRVQSVDNDWVSNDFTLESNNNIYDHKDHVRIFIENLDNPKKYMTTYLHIKKCHQCKNAIKRYITKMNNNNIETEPERFTLTDDRYENLKQTLYILLSGIGIIVLLDLFIRFNDKTN